jgi:hypothetical protein
LRTSDDISEFVQKRHFALRKPPFYPLNYGNRKKGKSKTDEGKIQMSGCRLQTMAIGAFMFVKETGL